MNLIDKIDSYLIERERKKRVSHYPSDASKCLRQLYYKWTDEKESNPIEAGGYWKMSMGNKIHDLINEFLENAGLEIVNEISVKKEIEGLKYPISGRIDNIFIDEDSTMSGIEIKSTYGAGVRAIKNKGLKESDIFQVLIYMSLSEIKRFYVLYIGRDDGYRVQFVIDIRNDLFCVDGKPIIITFKDIVFRLKLLELAIERREIPDREFKAAIKNGEIKDKFQKDKVIYKTDWQCSYCSYKNKCWKDDLEKYSSKLFIHKDSDNSELF
jgi:hypothetical protein